jgi:hypothetical protein
MIKEDMERDQQVVNEMMDERRRLTEELMAIRKKNQYITDSYNDRIQQLSNEIEAATSAPDFMNWWQQVKEEIDLLRRQQEKIKQAIAQGGRIKKAEAIRNLIERIDCKFISEPTTDGRCKGGFRAVCISVTIQSKTTNGQPIPTMTIETPSE